MRAGEEGDSIGREVGVAGLKGCRGGGRECTGEWWCRGRGGGAGRGRATVMVPRTLYSFLTYGVDDFPRNVARPSRCLLVLVGGRRGEAPHHPPPDAPSSYFVSTYFRYDASTFFLLFFISLSSLTFQASHLSLLPPSLPPSSPAALRPQRDHGKGSLAIRLSFVPL